MKVGLLHSLIRKEEKLLLEEFQVRGVDLRMIDDRNLILNLESIHDVDVVLERSINHSRSMYGLRLLEAAGIYCINAAEVAKICGDKILTSVALKEADVRQPPVRVAFTEASALEAI